jgi:hypothetical protein
VAVVQVMDVFLLYFLLKLQGYILALLEAVV